MWLAKNYKDENKNVRKETQNITEPRRTKPRQYTPQLEGIMTIGRYAAAKMGIFSHRPPS